MHNKEDILPLDRLKNGHKSASSRCRADPSLAAMQPRLTTISTAIWAPSYVRNPPLELPMQENFRQFLDRLRQAGELVDLHQPVDIRHIATLVDQADTALYFHNVIGYELPVVSGLIRTRERSMMALGCETYREIEDKLTQAINHPIP